MVLQSSGPISLSDIQSEFDGDNPISISEYYGADPALPGSGTISISDFYGLIKPPVITITGENPYYVPVGGSFSDEGATSDGGETVNVDTSNLTSDVETYGGDADIVYSATDVRNNTSYVIRTVKYPTREPLTGFQYSVTDPTRTYYFDPGWCSQNGLTPYIIWEGTIVYSDDYVNNSVTVDDEWTYVRDSVHSGFLPAYYACPPAPLPQGGVGIYAYGVYRFKYE